MSNLNGLNLGVLRPSRINQLPGSSLIAPGKILAQLPPGVAASSTPFVPPPPLPVPPGMPAPGAAPAAPTPGPAPTAPATGGGLGTFLLLTSPAWAPLLALRLLKRR